LTRPHSASRRDRAFRCPYTDLRIGEALGLTWADIDYEAGLIRGRRQLSRQRMHAPLKTEAAKREVILAPSIAKLLSERRLATLYKAPYELVFTTASGRGLDYRDVGLGFRDAVKRAGLQAPGRLSLHSLRHGFASLLIAEGMSVVFVSRQLGHANPSITPASTLTFTPARITPTRRSRRYRPATRRWACELRASRSAGFAANAQAAAP
jgi:integrase